MTVIVAVILAGLALAGCIRGTVFSGNETRRMRWRTRARVRPGPGFATLPELVFRWGRLAAIHHGKRARPSMSWLARVFSPATEYAVRLGRGPYWRKCWGRKEDQMLILAPPRAFKTAFLGDLLIAHPGAAIITETRPDLLEGTAGWRSRDGRPVQVFNPEEVGGYPSTFGWDIIGGCEDAAEAFRRASDLVNATQGVGDMQWWVEKAGNALAALMHIAAVLGADMGDVLGWAHNPAAVRALSARAAGHPRISGKLLGALAELERTGKAADSIRITMSKAVDWMAIPAIARMVTGPAAVLFDVEEWATLRGTIYMLAPAGEEGIYAPLYRCFVSFVHRAAKLAAQDLPGRRWDPRVLIALDELHLAPVDLPHLTADGAGAGIDVIAVIHSTGQLADKYGAAGKATVWGTTGTKVFLPGIHDAQTLEDVSRLCGTARRDDRESPAVPAGFLARLPDKRALVIRTNLFPVVVKIRPYWARWRTRLGRAPAMPWLAAAPGTQATVTALPVRAAASGAPIAAFEAEAAAGVAAAAAGVAAPEPAAVGDKA